MSSVEQAVMGFIVWTHSPKKKKKVYPPSNKLGHADPTHDYF